jgi:hypothetical protein
MSDVKKIHVGMEVANVVELLGKPSRIICSGVFCAEWKIDNGKYLFLWGVSDISRIELSNETK